MTSLFTKAHIPENNATGMGNNIIDNNTKITQISIYIRVIHLSETHQDTMNFPTHGLLNLWQHLFSTHKHLFKKKLIK